MSALVPRVVSTFMFDYLEARGMEDHDLIDLWAEDSGLLDHAVARAAAKHSVGLVSKRAPGSHAGPWQSFDGSDRLAYFDDQSRSFDVVLGVPPWGWQPRVTALALPNGPVKISDDPANVLLVLACTRLRPGGVGLFVVAPGFLMRPGPDTAFPVLQHLGIGLEALVRLPRGAFRPDTGSGRFLVALTHAPRHAPVTGVLAPDGTGCEDALIRVRRTIGAGQRRAAGSLDALA